MARSWYLNFRCANKANEINSLPKAIIASGGAKPGKNPGPLPPPLQQRPGGPSLSASRPWPAPSLAFVRHVVAVRRRPPREVPRSGSRGVASQRKAPSADTRRGTRRGQAPAHQECHLLSHDSRERQETEDRSPNVPASSRPRRGGLAKLLS